MSDLKCQAPRRDDTPCPHRASEVTIHRGRPVYTCGQHVPDHYRLYAHQSYSAEPSGALSPLWASLLIEALRDYAIAKRKAAQDHRDRARWLEAEAKEIDAAVDALMSKEALT